eukprot:scaffold370_cov176-Amphora_coffeaeformis.AAC.38
MLNRIPPSSPRNSKWLLSKSVPSFVLGTFFGFAASSLLFLSLFDMASWRRTNPYTTYANNALGSFPFPSNARDVTSSRDNPIATDGWKDLHVFAGDKEHIVDASTIPSDYYATTRWFSQLRQDFIVSTLLNGKRNGYFVDLAANDAIRISNTYALERDFGWDGLCIEPNPIYWSGLSYRRCQVIGAVVGHNRTEEVLFKFGSKGPQSGIVGKKFRNKQAIHNNEEKRRSTVTLQEIFERFETPRVIDYLSLDVEGAEEYIMESFPFNKYRFNVLTIEEPSENLRDMLKNNNYVLLGYLRKDEETLWVHAHVMGIINKSAMDIDIPKYSERVSRPS